MTYFLRIGSVTFQPAAFLKAVLKHKCEFVISLQWLKPF